MAAAALSAGLPVIATPVGGIIEQITDGVTGVLAALADGWALADAAEHLLFNPELYRLICQNIAAQKADRSIERFVKECVYVAIDGSAASSLSNSFRTADATVPQDKSATPHAREFRD